MVEAPTAATTAHRPFGAERSLDGMTAECYLNGDELNQFLWANSKVIDMAKVEPPIRQHIESQLLYPKPIKAIIRLLVHRDGSAEIKLHEDQAMTPNISLQRYENYDEARADLGRWYRLLGIKIANLPGVNVRPDPFKRKIQ